MSQSVARQLVRYRTWLAAVVNAGVTWVILIIAPLGLFAVITCTLAVFLGSLGVGWVCDRALFQLLEAHDRDVMRARRDSENFEHSPDNQMGSQVLPKQRRRNLFD